MNFRKSNGYLLTATMLLGSTAAIAAEPTWYAGVSAGTTKMDVGIKGTASGASFDDKDNGFKLLVGRKSEIAGVPGVGSYGLEGFYTNLGESTLTGNNGSTFSYNGTSYAMTANNTSVTVEGSAFGVGGVLFFPITKKAEISAKIGLARWDFEAKNTTTAGGFSLNESAIDFYYGIGASYQIGNNVAVGFEHERYTLSDNLDDADFTSINVQYSF